MTAAALRRLEDLRNAYGQDDAREKLALLTRLARSRLASAREIERLHEQLLFLRAYPDDSRVLARVRALLMRFARRPDLRAHRDALENTGIAGTAIRFPFFWPSARWLARHWPSRITLDRLDRAADRAIAKFLDVERRLGGFGALDRIRRRGITDAVQFIRLVEAMPGDARTKEAFYDAIEPVIELHAGRGTPNRTLASRAVGPVSWQRTPLDRARPDLSAELRRAPRRVRRVGAREGERLLDLARAAMATRSRDLDAFAYGDPRAVRIVDDGGSLAFSLNGVVAERQLAHAAPYGALTLRNGVPLGYSQLDMAGAHAEISFNTFPTFRNAEAARIFARSLALAWHVLGARRFSIEPYQLGRNNHEAIDSGAWWFYYKFGFRPRSREARAIARRELARMRESRAHRSSAATLERLANWHLYLDPRQSR